MPVYEITAPDGRILEVEGEKMPSENELNNIFESIQLNRNKKLKQTYISASPEKNLLTDFADCLKWVNNTTVAAFQEGKDQTNIGHLEAKDMFRTISAQEKERLNVLTNKPQHDYLISNPKYIDLNETNFIPRAVTGAKKGYIEAVKMLPYLWETIKAGGIGSAAGAAGGAAVGAGTALLTTKANVLPSTLQGARIGGAWGGRISGSLKLAELEGGLARNELKQINQEIIEKGGEPLSVAEINALSAGVGAVNAGLEMVSLKQILKTVPGGDKILEYLTNKNLRELAMNKTVREQMKGVLTQYGKTIATEVSTEMAQEMTNIIADETAKKLGKIENTPLEQNVARVIDTGKATFGATIFLGGAGSAAKTVSILRKQGMTTSQAQQKADSMSVEEQQEFVADNIDTLFKTVEDIPEVKEIEKTSKLQDAYFKQMKNIGIESDEAFNTSNFMAKSFVQLSKQLNIDIDEIENEANIVLKNMTDEQALEQQISDGVLKAGVEMNVQADEVHNQSAAMYKNPRTSFADFYDYTLQNKNTKNKFYYTFNSPNGISVDIPQDTIVHDLNKYNLSVQEWEDVLNKISAPQDAVLSNKKVLGQEVALLKIENNGNYYGVAVMMPDSRNIVNTVFKSSEKGVDAWIKKDSAKKPAPNHQAGSSITQSNNVSLGQNPNSFITRLQENFKPVMNNQGIFDNANPDIYYQSAMISGINPKQKIDVVDLTSKFANAQNLTRKDLSNYLKTLIGTSLKSKDKKAILNFVNRSKRVGKQNVYMPDHIANSSKVENKYKGERNTAVNNITDLVQNSVLIDIEPNRKKQSKPDVDNYLRFYVPVKINSDIYTVRISAENNTKNNLFNILDGNIYDVIIDKKIQVSAHSMSQGQSRLMKPVSNNSINGNAANINPETITIEEMLKNVQNPDGEAYYQGLNAQGGNIENARGFTYPRYNFDGTTKENLIVLLKNKSDKSTLLHEFAHVYLTTLNNLALRHDKAKDMLLTVNKWLRYDGREYTAQQHEKFANGFVAYVKSGKAPTYRLKRAFENFKKWLNDLYTNIQLDNEIEIDDEARNVFDELLGDITLDAQKKAGDRIIDKAKNNALIRLRNEVKEKGNVKFNQLTERQKRYRDTAYDIIWYALTHTKDAKTGEPVVKDKHQLYMILGNDSKTYTKKNKSIKNQHDKIYFILSELDDAFSANDGFLAEWGEFFNDPGVSYENQEIGADSELALMAYDAIVEKKYLYDSDSVYQELSNEDIKKADYELEYILNEYKNTDDKTIPMLAFYEWAESLHPFIQEDFTNKWETATNEIDRYQSLDKFQQAKEDLKIYAAKLQGYGDYSSQFAEYARAIVKRLDFMTESDKSKIFDKLKEFNSYRDIERNLDDVMDYAQTLAEVSERKILSENIIREVKQTIHTIQNGVKKTKYTYPANKLFTRLREISRMNQEEIQNLYDSLVNEETILSYVADEVHDEDYYKAIEKMFTTFRANGNSYNSTEFLQDLLNRIQGAKFSAKIARDEMDFERRMQQINLIDECAKALDSHKGKVSKLEQAYRHGFNLNSAFEMIFDKNIKNKFSLDYLYAQKDAKVGRDRDEVLNKIADVFGYKGFSKNILLFNKFIDMTKKEFKIRQRYSPDMVNGTYRVISQDKENGQTITEKTVKLRPESEQHTEWNPDEVELSRMEVLYYYIQAKNPVSYKMLTDMGDETTPAKGQFNKHEFTELLDNLTPQEKLMGDILQLAAEKYYPELNKYHIEKYHIDLGKASAYFPRKSETQEVKVLELFNDYVQQMAKPSLQKMRTAGPGVRIAPANALAVLFDHIEKSNTLIVMGRQLDLMNRVFKDSNLKRKIETVWGVDTAKEFMLQVTANLYGGQVSTISDAESLIGRIENNVIKSQIFLKPQVGLKQLISFMNYGVGDDYVSSAEWAKELAKQAFTPKEWKNNIKFMMENDYLRDRFTRGGSTDALKRQLEQRLFAKISLFDDIFSTNIRMGDIGAIILGGKPYIDVLMDKGYTKEQAFKIFIEKTVNDQQSSIPSTLSNIQRNASKQPLAKMLFAYQNTPWQYFRTAANSIIRFKQNPNTYTGLNMAKLTGLYLYIFPLIFNMASSLSPLMLVGGDDNEIKKDVWKSVIGGLTFVPIAGMFINSVYSAFQGEKASTGDWFDSAASKSGTTIRKVMKDDFTLLDLYNAVSLFGEAFTGVPLTTIGNSVTGAADVITGDAVKGILKLGGYTDYRAKKVTGKKD